MPKHLVSILAILLVGCFGPPRAVERYSVGETVAASPIPNAFNEAQKTRIETTEGFFVVVGQASFFKGKPASVVVLSDGEKWLQVEGSNSAYLILGY